MPLDPQTKLVLDMLPPDMFDLEKNTPLELRAQYESQTGLLPGEPVARVEDVTLRGPAGGIRARLYVPEGGEQGPGTVFFHGGGWVIGNLDTHDGTARKLANAAGGPVVSVDYRLAPEHRFPAAAEDCYAALQAVAADPARFGIDAGRICVAGDSAGGNLAAAVALMARDRDGPAVAAQALVYPVIDSDFDRPSYRDNAEGYLLTRDVMRWFWDQYVPEADRRRDPYVSPLAADSLAGLPPALVITAEYDPLHDEGDAYARRLEAEGVRTTLSRYEGMIHGFVSFADVVDGGKRAVAELGAFLAGRV